MFGISFEHILIVGVVLLLFGPKRLPELGKSLGLSIKNFKDSFNGIEKDSKTSDQIASLEKNKGSDDHPESKS
ncbi:MAG: twin-arginine translocase TatA/TatE family subunit [Bdellovibrionales bacterium]|nr:twin-arginine translocase TatA/TatE family subunit [Bdellovibrionales bacterium]